MKFIIWVEVKITKISDMIKLLEKHLNKKAKFKYSKHERGSEVY